MTHPGQVKVGSARLGIQHGYRAMLVRKYDKCLRLKI